MTPETILLIDDEPEVLATMVAIVERGGYRAIPIGDSREVVAALRGGAIDMVVSDIVMPHLDGLALLDLVKAERPEVPVLLVTSYAHKAIVEQARSRGAYGFLEKPIEPADLVAAVRQGLLRAPRKDREQR